MEIQVENNHYLFEDYVDVERWNSYYNQIIEIGKNMHEGGVLVIGKGDGIVDTIIDKAYKIRSVSFDFDASLEPDITGDVCRLSDYVQELFETVVCCQVLEHIPFEFFESVIEEISSICGNTLILSLPVRNIHFSFSFKIPKFRQHIINVVIPRFWEKNVPWLGEHYWEVGTSKKSIRDINAILKKYFYIERNYYCKQNPYHHFWILKKQVI